jgi:tetratricopeptide (TPR) repeat protein
MSSGSEALPPAANPVAFLHGAIEDIGGSFWLSMGQYQNAAQHFGAAIDSNGRDASAYFRRANAYAAAGMKTQALLDYDQALRLSPRLQQARSRRDKLLLSGQEPLAPGQGGS